MAKTISGQGGVVGKFIRRDLIALKGYEPIIPLDVLSERAGIPMKRVIKLDGNENPYGCSPRVQKALANYSFYHIYPDPMHRELRTALEGYASISTDHIVVGSGSDELIDLVLRLLLEPGDGVVNCPPTFGMYPFNTTICGGRVIVVPRNAAFAINIPAIKAAIDGHTKLIFITSPNNPSGNITSQDDILELVRIGIMVVIDEAYYEFSGETVAPLVPSYDNLIVLRSFSKWAGLAGLRIGYGIFPPGIAELLYKIKPPYNMNVAAQIAVRESLADIEYLQSNVRLIIAERERLYTKLRELEFLEPIPSQANFILCLVKNGDALEIKRELEKMGIFIRYFDAPRLRNMIRISVGKPEHTDALVEALRKVGETGNG